MQQSGLLLLILMCLTGCLGSPFATETAVMEHQTLTIEPDDPFIALDDGSRIAVEGLSGDQPARVHMTTFANSNGEIGVDVDIVEQ